MEMPRQRENAVARARVYYRCLTVSSYSELAPRLAETGRALHARGWALGTAGNFSAVVRREPLVLAISRSGVDKGDV